MFRAQVYIILLALLAVLVIFGIFMVVLLRSERPGPINIIFPTTTPVPITPTPTLNLSPTPSSSLETLSILVYFINNSQSGNDCNQVVAVQRTIPKTQAVARTSLEELLQGPTNEEMQGGFTTAIPSNVKIRNLSIDSDGTANVDFSEDLEDGVGGSCRVAAIREQITETLLQFDTIKNVVISINGRTGDILQP